MESTICAIATSITSPGAISIIRISGPKAIEKVNSIFKGEDLTKTASHTIHYGFIVDNQKEIDEVLVTIMRAPKTYTKEDTVEINCHGGYATTKSIMALLLKIGVCESEPGEFSKRAFLNGRIDLIESEAIMDLINAETEYERAVALGGLRGHVSDLIEKLRDKLVTIIANIEVNIDYPEYDDVEIITEKKLLPFLKEVDNELNDIIKESEDGKIMKNGFNISIIGRPNVGKSSILNKLLNEDKAIVTDISGTTRDIIEGTITIDGIKINFIDTAGIRETNDVIEKIGIKKSKEKINESDLIILVLNNNEELKKEDRELLDLVKHKNKIIFVNKNDLKKMIKLDLKEKIIYGNTEKNDGLNDLKKQISEIFKLNEFSNKNNIFLSNVRQINLAKQAQKKIIFAINQLNKGVLIDLILLDIKEAWELLGKIIGKVYEEEFLDELFSKFCLGK